MSSRPPTSDDEACGAHGRLSVRPLPHHAFGCRCPFAFLTSIYVVFLFCFALLHFLLAAFILLKPAQWPFLEEEEHLTNSQFLPFPSASRPSEAKVDAITPVATQDVSSTPWGDEKAGSDQGTTAKCSTGAESIVQGVTVFNPADPLDFGRHRRDNLTRRQIKEDHPNANGKKIKKFYTRQNRLIDQFLGADDEERLAVEEDVRMGPKIRFAVNASFTVNFCLFVIQLYAAISTGSLAVRFFSLFFRHPLSNFSTLRYN